MAEQILDTLSKIQTQLKEANAKKEEAEQRSRRSARIEQRLGPSISTDEELLLPMLFPSMCKDFMSRVTGHELGVKRRFVDRERRVKVMGEVITFWAVNHLDDSPLLLETDKLEKLFMRMAGKDAAYYIRTFKTALGAFDDSGPAGAIKLGVGRFVFRALAEESIKKLSGLCSDCDIETHEVRGTIPPEILHDCQLIDMNFDLVDGVEYIDLRDIEQLGEFPVSAVPPSRHKKRKKRRTGAAEN